MERIFSYIVRHKKLIIVTYVVILLICFMLSQLVELNYNFADYLPDETSSKQAIDILKDEFSNTGSANLLIEGKNIREVLNIKNTVESIEGVEKVIWLDDVIDIKQPIEYANKKLVENYWKDGNALLQIIFIENDYSSLTDKAIIKIKSIIGEYGYLTGSGDTANNLINSVESNTSMAMIIVIPLILIILVLSTNSFFEVILFLIVIGVSILINNGTNIIFGKISFITSSASSLLQLAIAMDYTIFLLHRFSEERKNYKNINEAMIKALKHSVTSISASAVTTIVGFLALLFMRFEIGADLGLVLAKGIFISLILVMTLLPVLTLIFIKLIDKTTHRSFIPSFKKIGTIMAKMRYGTLILLLLLAIPAFLGQNSNNFIYGSGEAQKTEEMIIANEKVEKIFGSKNPVLLLVPNNNKINEKSMADELLSYDSLTSVQGIYTFIDPEIPHFMIPEDLKDQFVSKNYSRYILNLNTQVESEKAFQALNDINGIVSQYYDDYYMTGATPTVVDMKEVSQKDFTIVTIVSIVAVGLVLLLTFRSISLPIILLLVIEVSIWINMSLQYFMGTSILFIGYLIVSAIQLGATIDYAILLTNRYQEYRSTMNPYNSAIESLVKSGHSILTSASILGIAGLTLYFAFDVATLRSIGLLVGRGAIISSIIVLLILPQLLVIFDKAIEKTTYKKSKLVN